MQRLSKWRKGLDDLVYTHKANIIPLEKYSEELLTMSYTVLEVPGQYLLYDGLSKPHPGNHNILSSVCPVVKMVSHLDGSRTHCSAFSPGPKDRISSGLFLESLDLEIYDLGCYSHGSAYVDPMEGSPTSLSRQSVE